MREIIHLQVGMCGNYVGQKHWESVFEEYFIGSSGRPEENTDIFQEKIGVYLNETPEQKYIARNISINSYNNLSDPNCFCKDWFDPGNFVQIPHAGNNWAKGYLGNSEEIVSIMDLVKTNAEMCDSLQAFEISHSVGGGSGSGLTSLIISQLKDEFPDLPICTQSIFPSPGVTDCVVEPYNAMLTFPFLNMPGNVVFAFDNESLYNLCFQRFNLSTPTYGDLNCLIKGCLGGATSSLRFPGMQNGDFRKLMSNLIPDEKMKYLALGFSPITCRCHRNAHSGALADYIADLISTNVMCHLDTNQKIISLALNFRGFGSRISEIKDYFENDETINGIPKRNVIHSLTDSRPTGLKFGASSLINSTGIQGFFKKIHSQYSALKRRNAFMHWYTDEGIEEEEFINASDQMEDLIQCYESATNS